MGPTFHYMAQLVIGRALVSVTLMIPSTKLGQDLTGLKLDVRIKFNGGWPPIDHQMVGRTYVVC